MLKCALRGFAPSARSGCCRRFRNGRPCQKSTQAPTIVSDNKTRPPAPPVSSLGTAPGFWLPRAGAALRLAPPGSREGKTARRFPPAFGLLSLGSWARSPRKGWGLCLAPCPLPSPTGGGGYSRKVRKGRIFGFVPSAGSRWRKRRGRIAPTVRALGARRVLVCPHIHRARSAPKRRGLACGYVDKPLGTSSGLAARGVNLPLIKP